MKIRNLDSSVVWLHGYRVGPVFMHIKCTCHCASDPSITLFLPANEIYWYGAVASNRIEIDNLAQGRKIGNMVLVKVAERKAVNIRYIPIERYLEG